MATYVIDGYAVGAIAVTGGGAPVSGSTFRLDPNWSASTAALTITVTDDDAGFSGSATAVLDGSQTGVVVTASGATLASGVIRLGNGFAVSDPVAGSITFYQVIVGATVVGYVSTAPLQPGVQYTVTSVTATTAAGVPYGNLALLDHEQAADNSLTGGGGNDSLLGGAGNDTLTGGAGNDTILGGSGNDVITGGAGADSLLGEDGDDSFIVATGSAADSIFGGAGNDTISFATATVGANVVFSGTGTGSQNLVGVTAVAFTGIEAIEGSGFNDTLNGALHGGGVTLSGNGGADTITGGAGGDALFGGTGSDTLTGNAGNDLLDGGEDSDFLYGGTGNNTLSGGAGNDRLEASTGLDEMFGGAGIDTIFGGDGNDTLDGGDESDSLYGGNGNDLLEGGAGNDLLDGGSQDDTLRGGLGDDSILGQGGNDLFLIEEGGGTDTLMGSSGTDMVDTSLIAGGVSIEFSGTGTGRVDGPGTRAFLSAIERAQTGGGNDTVLGSSGAEWVAAGGGSDSLFGGGGSDSFFGEDGDDLLDGGAAADTLYGGAGADTLIGGAGNDSTYGDDGDDRFIVAPGDGSDRLFGGDGRDTVDFTGFATAVEADFSGAGAGTASSSAGTTTFSGMEVLETGAGNDTITGAGGADIVFAGAGNDRLFGGGGADLLSGGDGRDSLEGGDGNDTLIGGAGIDTIFGGTGLDIVDYSASDAAVNINLRTWTATGGHAQGDVLSGVDGVIGSAFDDTIIGFDDENAAPSDFYYNVFEGGAGNDVIEGRGGSDALFGGADNDTVLGGDGSDTVEGEDGDDLLSGDGGNDTIAGGAGNDTISGGAGNDTLSGGAGRDIFVFGQGGGTDQINDLDLTLVDGQFTDRIDVSGLVDSLGNPVNWADATVTSDGAGGALVSFPGGEVIRLVGIDPALISGKPALIALGVPCFGTGTRLLTDRGEVAVEAIRAGDRVVTLDHGVQRVVWAGGRHLDRAALEAQPLLRPVLIRDGAMGNRGDVIVSPNHAVLAEVDGQEMLVRAKHLAELGDPRFRIAKGRREVGYHHILLERHGIVFAQGMATETMYPGPMAVAALGPVVAGEIAAAFPLLAPVLAGLADAEVLYGPTARPVARRRMLFPAGRGAGKAAA